MAWAQELWQKVIIEALSLPAALAFASFGFTMFMAYSFTSETAILRLFSDPILKNFLIFQMSGIEAVSLP